MEDQAGQAAKSKSTEPLIVIASNRGPYAFRKKKDGSFATRRGEGGLVTALAALAQSHDVLWIAAALSKDDQEWASAQGKSVVKLNDMSLRLIIPDHRRYRMYYNVISNPLLWFIHHELWDSPRNPVITRDTWEAWREGYVAINRRFAEVIAEAVNDSVADTNRPVIVFPQDYHLYLVPHFLRQLLGRRVQIQPFIHIPWPGPDSWRALPSEMRLMLLESLLESDRVGFQTSADAFNFVQTCRIYVESAHSHGSRTSIEWHGRTVDAKAYPISIDVQKVEALAEDRQTRLLKQQLLHTIADNRLILRIDRIEPSKNILRGFLAFRELLEQHPEHRGKIKMLALLVPSRMEVVEYQTYLQEIMAVAGLINAEFSDSIWEPTRIIIGNNYQRAIAAMQLSDVLLVNPIADGMNLVAKEGPLVNERGSVLVLSELAGAFYELGDYALTISPYDVYSTAEALHQALTMPSEERFRRAEALRTQIRGAGVKAWFYNQVQDALRALESHPSSNSTPLTPSTSTSALS
ncbi:MAG: trehalose-6-phosphate synthase [Chloroflexi bacterium]|nr:trehalose-6-phosphate synthase [Chloroflexota bacterium]